MLAVPTPGRSYPFTMVYDPDAAAELATAVRSKEDRKAVFNELRQLGEHLAPPHMKPLPGADARGLRELRPRQGRSDWRPLYVRRASVYVIVAVDRHVNLDTLVKIAAVTGAEFAIDIAPQGATPRLVGTVVKDTPAHVYGAASLLVAAR